LNFNFNADQVGMLVELVELEILGTDGQDIRSITGAKIYQQLEKNLGVDLADRKEKIYEMVAEMVEKAKPKPIPSGGMNPAAKRKMLVEPQPVEESSSEEESEDGEGEEEEAEEKQEEPAAEEPPKKKGRGRPSGAAAKGTKAKAVAKPKASGSGDGRGSGINKVLKLSPELAALMGEKNMSRPQVIKKMWAYVKENGLQDPEDKKFTICNPVLEKVMGVPRFQTFGMMKFMKTHFLEQ
jgi:upstream activation factor subunit UAF30